jgi:phosphodiesterase/alkaline phosphatase D-like protein
MTPKKIAFVSCAEVSRRKSQPAWARIQDEAPDMLIMLGDNTYMSWEGGGWDFDALERNYQNQRDVPEFKRLIEWMPPRPILATWDDHDFGPNDSGGMIKDGAKHRDRSRQLFHQYIDFALKGKGDDVYCAHHFGDVHVIMLDVRYERTESGGVGKTILGKRQEDFLWEELAKPGKIKLIGSGTPISEGAPGQCVQDYTVFWKRLQSELRFDPIRQRRCIYLAGDIHKNAFVNHDGFFEAISSGVACFKRGNGNDFSEKKYTNHWAMIEIEGDRITIRFHGNRPTSSNTFVKSIRISDWTLIP